MSRDSLGRFGPGNNGKPIGARHKATLAAEALLDGEAETLTRKCVEMAKGGDITAMRLCLERILPARKGRPIRIDIPAVSSASDIVEASSAVFAAVAAGDLTPTGGTDLGGLVELQRRAIETAELERRLVSIERRLNR
jgi:hypothetical protein